MAACLPPARGAVTPTIDELSQARQWALAHFKRAPSIQALPRQTGAPDESGLLVLANNDAVEKNEHWGKKLNIAGTNYARGLFCHALSRVIVHLPSPGRTFTATIGVHSNEFTRGGKGTIVFSVEVKGKPVLQSKVMREGMPGVPVKVELGEAKQFALVVGDAGDGISYDNAIWGYAKATLADGQEVWLDELPFISGIRPRLTTANSPPFSFIYDGKASDELLGQWPFTESSRELEANRTELTQTYTDPKSGLVVRQVAIQYRDFPTLEWTLHFKNTGTADTAILENIQGLDAVVKRSLGGEFLLHHNVGSPCMPRDYAPLETPLGPKARVMKSAAGGRPSNTDLPYFNLAWPDEGLIVVVGWPGQWQAEFIRDATDGLRIVAGQQATHFRLHPGEEVRAPLIVLQFYRSDWLRAQNVWRRWMLAHNLPRIRGQLPEPMLPAGSALQFAETQNATEQNQKFFIDRYLEERIPITHWWMDAGWYPFDPKIGWANTGTWEVDTNRFPRGLRAIYDHAHAKGVRSVVWFEPERVGGKNWLSEHHPEWVLGALVNLGHPQARQWVIEHFSQLIADQGVDVYRQDFNIDPLSFWIANDAADRQGITEIKHLEGYLAYWDELRRRFPHLLIDTCASGGRRNDLETLRRAVPLHRSDAHTDIIGRQSQTYGISFWIPYHGSGVVQVATVDPYAFLSTLCPSTGIGYDVRRTDLDYALLRKLTGIWRKLVPNLFGDYYPLTPYSLEKEAWMAWQFDRPEAGEGLVQAFRRDQCADTSRTFMLHGLEALATYVVTDEMSGQHQSATGQQLMQPGLVVNIPTQPGAAVFSYRKSE